MRSKNKSKSPNEGEPICHNRCDHPLVVEIGHYEFEALLPVLHRQTGSHTTQVTGKAKRITLAPRIQSVLGYIRVRGATRQRET